MSLESISAIQGSLLVSWLVCFLFLKIKWRMMTSLVGLLLYAI